MRQVQAYAGDYENSAQDCYPEIAHKVMNEVNDAVLSVKQAVILVQQTVISVQQAVI